MDGPFLSLPLRDGEEPVPTADTFRRFFRRLPTLETERLFLRPVRRGDADDLFAYASDPEVCRHVLWSAHRSREESVRLIRQLRRQYRYGIPGSFAIELKATGRMIGTIGVMQLYPEHRCAEVGYSLARPYWNQGLMTEALREMLRFCFETVGLNRVEALHETDNPASGRVMEKAGMKPEGVLRRRIRNKGRYSDVRIWAAVKGDRPDA